MKRKKGGFTSTGIPSIATFFLICVFIENVHKSPSLPGILKIIESARNLLTSEAYYANIFYTMRIVGSGLLISLVVGVTIAIICDINKTIGNVIMPIVNSTKNIPSIALFPVFIILLGIGDEPRIVVIVWNSIYPIISSTIMGLNSPDSEVIEAAKNCGATNTQIYRYIRFPIALVYILEGLKVAAGNGFIAVVVADMLGATRGLGYMVLWLANSFRYADMYVYIITIAVLGLLINEVIQKIINITERKMFND